MSRTSAVWILLGILTLSSVAAQPSTPAFEVASIKQNTSVPPLAGAGGGAAIGRQGHRFTAVNAPLRDIIRYAFDLQAFQHVQGDFRVLDDRFDITAVIPQTGAAVDESRLMLRTLLAERFTLSTRWVSREQPVHALVLARRDGRLGAAMKASTADCDAVRRPSESETDAISAEQRIQQLMRATCDVVVQPFRGRIVGNGRTVSDLALVLSRLPMLQGAVVDRTGVIGRFDFELLYATERTGVGGTPAPSSVESPPSLREALQEQLGLKLESTRGPVDVLVIDSVQRPSEN